VTSNLQTFSGLSSASERSRSWFQAELPRRRAAFWAIVVLLGLLQAWAHRLIVDYDGVSYLDIADDYAHGAWSSAINGYWSPLYSWLLAIVIYPLKFLRSWESTLLHLVNFSGYLGAYASFEFFLTQLMRSEQENSHSDYSLAGSESAWHTLGLGLFLYSSLYMANHAGSSPDIFVVFFVYLAAGLLMRMQSGQAQAGTYGAFGAALGFGYLAKTAMFPLSLVFLAVAGFTCLRQPKWRRAFLLAPVCFTLVAWPWIMVLSHAKGRFTFGDVGRLAYAERAGARVVPLQWGGLAEAGQNLIHPPRLLWADPPVIEFATPVPGTFPLWHDSYWGEGMKIHFSWTGQLRVLHESYDTFLDILNQQKEYLLLLLFMIALQGTVLDYFKAFLRRWVIWLPATAALGMYALVLVQPRYIAPFLVMLWLSLFAVARLPRNDMFRRFVFCAVVATVLTTGVGILRGALSDFHLLLRPAPDEQAEIAEGLHELGVLDGRSIATIGIPRETFYWARLARLRIVSEIPTENVNQFWFASPGTREKVRSLFAQAGAVAIVTDTMPAGINFSGWEPIGRSSYFVFLLPTGAVSGEIKPVKASH
jgi:hypothetical protein